MSGLPAIMNINIPDFAKENEKVWYNAFSSDKENEIKLKITNSSGVIIKIKTVDRIFKMWRIK